MDLHLHQQQAHIINGDLIVRICSAGILPEEIPSGKPVPLPRLQSPAAPLHPWMKCYWSLLLLLRHAKCSDSRSEADHSPAVLRDVTQSSADRQTERQTETCTHTDTHTLQEHPLPPLLAFIQVLQWYACLHTALRTAFKDTAAAPFCCICSAAKIDFLVKNNDLGICKSSPLNLSCFFLTCKIIEVKEMLFT